MERRTNALIYKDKTVNKKPYNDTCFWHAKRIVNDNNNMLRTQSQLLLKRICAMVATFLVKKSLLLGWNNICGWWEAIPLQLCLFSYKVIFSFHSPKRWQNMYNNTIEEKFPRQLPDLIIFFKEASRSKKASFVVSAQSVQPFRWNLGKKDILFFNKND